MPFIMIDQGSPAIKHYTRPEQTGTAPLSPTNPARSVESKPQAGQQPYQQHSPGNRAPQRVFHAFEIMSTPAISLEIHELGLKSAWELMHKHSIKHLPITKNGTLNAIVCESDILKALAFKHDQSQWLQQKVFAATEQTDIHQLAHVMFDENIGCLPIVNDNHEILGMVTRSDILKLSSQYGPMEFWA